MRELGGRIRQAGGGRKLLELIEAAVRNGVLILEDVDVIEKTGISAVDRLTLTDSTLLAHARRLKSSGDTPVVVTADRDVILAGMKAGLEVLTPTDVWNELESKPASSDTPLSVQAEQVAKDSKQQPRVLVLFGVAIGLSAVLVLEHLAFLVDTLPVWGTLIGLTLLAALLYWVRGRLRLPYGIAELIVGLASAWLGVQSQNRGAVLNPVAVLQVLGGLYVMVRGLDNIGKGVHATRYSVRWERYFGRQ